MSRKSRRPKGPLAPRVVKPMHLTFSLDGGPGDLEPDCPICAMLAATGTPVHTLDEHGDVRLVEPGPAPAWITVVVKPDARVAAVLGSKPKALQVPAGCDVRELLALVAYEHQRLADAFPPRALRLAVNGVAVPDGEGRVLADGDRIDLGADRQPDLSAGPN